MYIDYIGGWDGTGPRGADMPAFWWVNHKQTFEAEVGGGYMWSPKTNKGGSFSHYYENMTKVRPGDLVFSYANTAVRAVGIVLGRAEPASRPVEFGKVGDQWDSDGWLVSVKFRALDEPFSTIDNAAKIAPLLPSKYSPIQANGHANQVAYLSSVAAPMAELLLELMGEAIPKQAIEDAVDTEITNRTDIPATKKLALRMSRIGQGLYRKNLVQLEPACRVTGLADQRFLIASHMKPWALSSDFEKLDGNNGLLLSPHVDKLFDRGFISFADDGSMLARAPLPTAALKAWGISSPVVVKPFRAAQLPYLAFHRRHHRIAG